MSASECLLCLSGILTVLYCWMKYHYAYWRRKNVPYIEPNPIFGNLKELFFMKSSSAEHMINLYSHKDVKDQPVAGIYIFNRPALLIRDLELIKKIMIKDFNKFSDRFLKSDPHLDALGSYNLFFIKNPEWKELRTKLTPVFSSSKLKQMFPLIAEIGSELDKHLCDLPDNCIKEVKDLSALYTTDVIASVAFGVQANSIQNPEGKFRRIGKLMFTFTPYRAFVFSIVFFLPQFFKLFRCKLFPEEASTFLRNTIQFVMKERLKSGISRNDLIDILLAFKKLAESGSERYEFALKDDMLVAQAAFFFSAGFETSSALMSFGMYELSKNKEVQNRLRREIKETLAKNNCEITYEMLQDMEYLNMVAQEVLRLYPPLAFLERQCTLPRDEKEYSLKPQSDFAIPNQMPVYIPIFAIQRDPKYFPNPDKFDPERFSTENKANMLPMTHIPFGTGPHNCIGERFGLLQAKIGLISFLKNHSVTTCEKSHTTMQFEPKAMILQSKGGIYCKLIRDPLES